MKKILQKKNHERTAECLQSVPGIGAVVASAFMLELFAHERFARAEEVNSYLGLATMVRHSGEDKVKEWLMTVGQTRLRSILIQATRRWICKDPGAKARYQKILSNTWLTQKSIVAMARKLAIMLWRLSMEQRFYAAFAA